MVGSWYQQNLCEQAIAPIVPEQCSSIELMVGGSYIHITLSLCNTALVNIIISAKKQLDGKTNELISSYTSCLL